MSTVAAPEDQAWRTARERGSVLGIRFIVLMTTALGRAPTRLFLKVIAFYYALFSSRARRGTRAFMSRIGGRPVGFMATYRQVLRFAQMGLDALFFLAGRTKYFDVRRRGTEHLYELVESRRGGLLLSAHLGSMYAMRAKGGEKRLPVRPVVYTRNAERITALFRAVNPDSHDRLIQMGDGMEFMLTIREEIEAGAIVALMGDRVGNSDRAVEVDFLGKKARFPTGPYVLAATLRCPVYLTFGLYREPNVYELYCEPFAEQIVLPRKRRQEALTEYVERYASRLEHYCRLAPDNWFNFYDFWEGGQDG